MQEGFWSRLDQIVAVCGIKIDRPKGSTHPRYPSCVYPVDYGYLEGTQSGDGDGIDVWVGTLLEKRVTGIVCSVDMEKRDAEIKILWGCTPQETQDIIQTHNVGASSAIGLERPVNNATQQDRPDQARFTIRRTCPGESPPA